MNFSSALLAVSLAGNAILLSAIVLRPTLVPPRFREAFTVGAPVRERPSEPAAKPRAAPAARPLWPMLETENVSRLIARLRAAGFPASIIRDMIRTEIHARYEARITALTSPGPNQPYWRLPPGTFSYRSKQMEDQGQLHRERAKVLRELFADPFFHSAETSAAERRQFGNLSRQQIDQLQRIEDDYAEMMSAIRGATNGVLLREDRDKLAFLAREKQADLAAILPPTELSDYDMRSSPITRILATELGEFRASEAEFRAIFSLQKQLNDQFPPTSGTITHFEQQRATQQQLNEQLRAALGDRRFADYVRETSQEFRQLRRLADQERLSPNLAAEAFDLRNSVSQDSVRIADDLVLTSEEKRAALAKLAEATRTRLLSLLGPVVGPSYVTSVNKAWLVAIETGGVVTFTGSPDRSMGFDNVMIHLGSTATIRRVPYTTAPSPRP